MEWKPQMWPTYAAEVLRARAALRLGDEVGLAVRAERQRLGMSQRAYAAHRGWTLGTVIRLESAADAMKLGDVAAALDGTAFQLCLCHRPPSPEPGVAALPAPDSPDSPATDADPSASTAPAPGQGNEAGPSPGSPDDPPTAPQPVHPAFWPRAELVARVRGGGRRFPAHHVTQQVGTGPPWWWYAESSRGAAMPPNWYAPQYTQRRPSAS